MIRMLLFLAAAVVTVTAIFRDRNEDLARVFVRRRRQSQGKRSVDAACALAISFWFQVFLHLCGRAATTI